MTTYAVVDLFCGVGGLSHGFIQEGFDVIAGIDNDETCRYAYETNNDGATFIKQSIEDLTADDIINAYPEDSIKILVGCAPCQPFSKYTNAQPRDKKKWGLLDVFADLILATSPDIISMENVPELKRFDKGAIYNAFFRKIAQQYHVAEHIVYCPDYGIPQKRKRLLFFASKFGPITLTPKTHLPDTYRTVRQVIGDLPVLEAGQTSEQDPLHRSSSLSEINLARIRHSIPGGTWKDWPEELLAPCHQKESGKSYNSVYGRMKWDEPSPTITTEAHSYGSGRFGHPDQDRAISLREAALLQTFPQDYSFIDSTTQYYISTVARHIGNAVPVDLGRVVARSIKEHLEALQ